MVGGNSAGDENVRIDFELYEGNVQDLPTGYQEVSCHLIFDVKIGENLCRKPRIVEVGNNTTKPY